MGKKIVLQTGDLLTHKDFEGKDLHVGDEVVACDIRSTINRSFLCKSIIVRETPTSIVTDKSWFLPKLVMRT